MVAPYISSDYPSSVPGFLPLIKILLELAMRNLFDITYLRVLAFDIWRDLFVLH